MKTHNNHLNTECCICSQIIGFKENDLISSMLNESSYSRRVILENDDFVVIPSLGALVDGHVIICPKEHVKSFALLHKNNQESYKKIKDKLSDILRRTFDCEIHYFEHGSAEKEGKLVCTVDHAHIHVLPTNVEVLSFIDEKYSWIELNNSLNDLKKFVGSEEYLFYEAPNGKTFLSVNQSEGFESQYMRQVFAKALNKSDSWNWRLNPNPELTNNIYCKLVNTANN